MRTNIILDDELIKEAFKYSKEKTKTGLIHEALREFIKNKRRLNLADLKGKIKFREDYDYKKLRESK